MYVIHRLEVTSWHSFMLPQLFFFHPVTFFTKNDKAKPGACACQELKAFSCVLYFLALPGQGFQKGWGHWASSLFSFLVQQLTLMIHLCLGETAGFWGKVFYAIKHVIHLVRNLKFFLFFFFFLLQFIAI